MSKPNSSVPAADMEARESSLPEVGLSHAQLMLRAFVKNRLALGASGLLAFLYITTIFAEFFAPYSLEETHRGLIHVPPQRIHFVDSDGDFHWRPFTYRLKGSRHPETRQRIYVEDTSTKYPVKLFLRRGEYRLLGIFRSNLKLFGVEGKGSLFLLGTDHRGRDLLSRILFGGRISLSIGLIGVTISIVLGVIIGCISGFYGGVIDNMIQRIVEAIRLFPQVPLWLALSAALPGYWSSVRIYFGIATLLALIGWTELARQVRAKVLAMRDQEFVTAAKAVGAGDARIIAAYLIPNVFSHIIVVATLSIPGMILAESTLSFLGLGIKPPMTSWGMLLQEGQNIQSLDMHFWILIPGIFILVTILAFNFFGDGLRDAADPFKQ